MTGARARRGVLGVLVLVLVALSGCISVPTTGPVERVEGQQPSCQSCVNVEVAPPAPGDDPGEIVAGFLRANATFQPNYTVARQFLTQQQASSWAPSQTWIYTGQPNVSGNAVKLAGTLIGLLQRDRTFVTQNQRLGIDFKLVQENGEWRISTPPPVLLVTQFAFASFYARYDLYYLGAGDTLVPNGIYLASLRAPASIASALVRALLEGPSEWLSPAVSSAAPANTTLSVDSVAITDGTAQVSLSENIQTLSERDRTLLSAQLVYTLKQVVGIKKVLLQVGAVPLRVAGSEPGGEAVPVEGSYRELDPVPFVSSEQLYAVHGRKVEKIGANADTAQPVPVPGPLGEGAYAVDSLAVTAADTELALVTDDRTVLRRTPTATTAPTTVLDGVTDLLRPQFSRTDELWAVGNRGGRQRLWVSAAGSTVEVEAPVLEEGRVRAFRISPDGSRMALVVQRGRTTTLGVALIIRGGTTTVEDWRPLDTSTPLNTSSIDRIRDVAWSDAATMVVLGAQGRRDPYLPSSVSDDAAEVETETQTNDWDAREIAVLLRTGTAVVVSSDERAFRDDGAQWRQFLDGVTAVAYPG